MTKYTIEESTLTGIADAIRGKVGETEIAIVTEKCQIAKSGLASGFNDYGEYTGGVGGLMGRVAVVFEGADSVKVRLTYASKATGNTYFYIIGGNYPDGSDFPYSSATKLTDVSTDIVEYVFDNTDSVSFAYRFYANEGFYAECYAYDSEGNEVGAKREKEVKRLFKPVEMADAIDSIVTLDIPDEAFTISGDCTYMLAYDNWNWYMDTFKDKIKTKDITNAERMFCNCYELKEIPFKLNFANQTGVSLTNVFYGCAELSKIPTLNIPNASKLNLSAFLSGCSYIRDANGIFENEEEFGASWQSYVNTTEFGNHYVQSLFNNMYSLRTVPTWFYKLKLNPDSTSNIYPNYCLYYRLFYSCYALDEIKDVPVWKCKAAQTKNMFDNIAPDCRRAKEFTFELDADGNPIVVEWKTQTIDLSNYFGFSLISNYVGFTSYNAGLDMTTRIKDDATYEQFKNHPDAWTTDIAYSRYNRESAIRTLQSLPDTSAYLATAGGTNTIKFKGAAGSKTDGGAINTMTSEEIAIATAKGWTVTFA